MVTKKLFFMDCHLAGRKYHDADEVWEDLKVGTTLRLERDIISLSVVSARSIPKCTQKSRSIWLLRF